MSSSALENEDLENVPLVRMEDVQPSRTYEVISRIKSDEEELETCVIDDIVYDNECIVNNDDDSNIGSMVSIQSEEVVEDTTEMIVPDIIDEKPVRIKLETKAPTSWPTLEILPGGVIKKPQKYDSTVCPSSFEEDTQNGQMMFACAKCSQRFKYLFCLVKHVKWHEDEAKKLKGNELAKTKRDNSSNYVCMHSNKQKMLMCMKSHKKKSPKKIKSSPPVYIKGKVTD